MDTTHPHGKLTTIGPAIAHSLELQRRGHRVVVQQERGEVTVYLGKRNAPIASHVKASAGTFALALERAVQVTARASQRS
jgi:hypothetical protein